MKYIDPDKNKKPIVMSLPFADVSLWSTFTEFESSEKGIGDFNHIILKTSSTHVMYIAPAVSGPHNYGMGTPCFNVNRFGITPIENLD